MAGKGSIEVRQADLALRLVVRALGSIFVCVFVSEPPGLQTEEIKVDVH